MDQDLKPLFDYLDDMKSELKADIVRLESKTDKLQNTVDSFAKSNIKFDQELTVQAHRVDKIEAWVKPASEKINIPYIT